MCDPTPIKKVVLFVVASGRSSENIVYEVGLPGSELGFDLSDVGDVVVMLQPPPVEIMKPFAA